MEPLCEGANAEFETGVGSGVGSDLSAHSFTYISTFSYARNEASVGKYIVTILELSMVLSKSLNDNRGRATPKPSITKETIEGDMSLLYSRTISEGADHVMKRPR